MVFMQREHVFRRSILPLLIILVGQTFIAETQNNTVITDTLWNILSSKPLKRVFCFNYSTCTDNIDARQCFCDEYCDVFNDCCNGFSAINVDKNFLNRRVKCYDRSESKTTRHMFMISDCPDGYNEDDVRRKCERHASLNAIEKVPVTSNQTFLTYRNKYCALCNDVHDFYVWWVDIYCKTFYKPRNTSFNALIQSYMDSEDCDFVYIPFDSHFTRECLPDSIPSVNNNCPVSYRGPLTEQCDKYFGIVNIFRNNKPLKTYRNIDCLACDNSDISVFDTDEFSLYCGNIFDNNNYRRQSLFAVLDFSKFLFGSNSAEIRSVCTEQEIEVDGTEKCTALHCPDLQIPYYGDCMTDVTVNYNTVAYDVLFLINTTHVPVSLQNELHSFLSNMKYKCYGIFGYIRNINKMDTFPGSVPNSNETCSYVKLYFELYATYGLENMNAYDCPRKFFEDMSYTLSNNAILRFVETIEQDTCVIEQKLKPSNFITYVHSLRQSTSGVNCPSIEVEIQPKASQNITGGGETAFQVTYRIGSVQIDKDDVNSTEHGNFICIEVYKLKYAKGSRKGRAQENLNYGIITTYTGISLSLILLSVTLVHYLCIPKMSTKHTPLLLHLLVMTMVANALYLITLFDFLCWWAAIGLHFLYLSMFMTMSLALLKISINLRTVENPSYKQSKIQLFIRFISPAYLVPFLVVGTTVTLNTFHNTDKDWYGAGTTICFISDAMVLCFAFALPVALCIIFNIVTFSLTFKALCIPESTAIGVMGINRNTFWIMAKLSSLTGLTWTLGFLAVLTDQQVFVYSFEVTSSLQGFFLGFSLLYNNKVKVWYKRCCGNPAITTEMTS